VFFRRKHVGCHEYLQIVANERIAGRHRQSVIATLGRIDELEQSGTLERLLRSGARFCEQVLVLSALERGQAEILATRRIGAPLIFERLWQETGCAAVIEALAAERGFGFALERAVFLTVLHRLLDPGSDRAAARWRDAYAIPGTDDLDLHHLYRAMAWLGEELADQRGAGLAPRTTKDRIEEALFARRRHLFNALGIVLYDTTSLYFEGNGGTLGQFGHSKDHRPDLRQVILAVVVDAEGRPILSELWPGNTTDVTTLLPVIARLKQRFLISRVRVVADRGMISAATIAELERQGIEYVLGVRERRAKEIAGVLAECPAAVPLSIPKAVERDTTDLMISEVVRGAGPSRRRYIVCRNEAEAEKDAAEREAILASLREKLKASDLALVGNRGYRRFLKPVGGKSFAIDPARVEADARFDGVYVLRTNASASALEIAITYRQRYLVEEIFRSAKALLATRPVFHKCDDTIRGHIFCSFLALVLRKELMDRLAAAGRDLEWAEVIFDLERLVETEIVQDGKRFLVRPAAPGCAGVVFQAVGVALPPMVRAVGPPSAPPRSPQGRPKRRKRGANAAKASANLLEEQIFPN
jgi:Transposase DDE domain